MRTLKKTMTTFVIALLSFSLHGCAIHYFDPETGTEHLWGIGHMRMKAAAPNEGLKALVRGTETMGVGLGSIDGQGYLTLGWQRRQRLDILDENTAIRLEWPDSDFFSVRVGSEFPTIFSAPQADKATDQEQETKK